jgi:chromosome partitioning protein
MDPKITAQEAASILNLSVQAIHKRLKSKDLPFKKSQNRIYFGHETARELFKFSFKNIVMALAMIKGGVGKTEESFCIAVGASLYGAKTLLIDIDPQANITKNCFGIIAKDMPIMIDVIKDDYPIEDTIIKVLPGIDLIPSFIDNSILDGTLLLGGFPLDRVFKQKIDILRSRYDLIIFDCPTGFHSSIQAAALASDRVHAPLVPDESSREGVDLIKREIERLNKTFGTNIILKIVLNKFNARNSLSHITYETLTTDENYKSILFGAYIRESQDFPKAIHQKITVFDTLKKTTSKEDMHLVVQELLGINELVTQKD